MAEDDDCIHYDRDRLRRLLEGITAGRGSVHWREEPNGRSSGLLLPSPGSPGCAVFVTVIADEAVITAGLGAMEFLSCGEVGDEEHVAEVVTAIIDGGATEYGIFDDEEPFTTSLVIEGAFGGYSFDTTGAVPMGPLTPWPSSSAADPGC